MLSLKSQFAGKTVLVTGSLGFLGSTVLEKLLRETEVDRVLVLVRGKKQTTPQQRVQQLLGSPLFHLLQKQALHGSNTLSRVHAIEGDLLLPELGVSAADRQLLQEVDVVLHCAASMELQADMQKTIKNNYLGTQKLLQLASTMPHLAAFVHVSTYYTCNHLPRNSLVKEQLYPLQLSLDGGATKVGHAEFVSTLMKLQPGEANELAAAVMQANSFGSTYAFGKSLTEQLVADSPVRPGLAKAIVRPALISSLAGSPYPGFVQGYAGPGGYIMAYAMGFFQGLSSVAYGSDQILDLIPCDTVAALVIAAAAAAAADTQQAAADTAGGSSGSTTFYHASSSASHPLPIADGFGYMAEYWSANPPPLRLPLTKYVRYTRPHTPTTPVLQQCHKKAAAKAQLLAALMRLAGERRQAYKLLMGVKAFGVQNSIPLAASMVCAVDNVERLRQRITPEERQAWPVLWAPNEPGGMVWRSYSFQMQSGVRQLLFGLRTPENVAKVCCAGGSFELLAPAVSAEQLGGLLQGGKVAAATGRFGSRGRFNRSISTSIRRSVRRSLRGSMGVRNFSSIKRSDSSVSVSSNSSTDSSSSSSSAANATSND